MIADCLNRIPDLSLADTAVFRYLKFIKLCRDLLGFFIRFEVNAILYRLLFLLLLIQPFSFLFLPILVVSSIVQIQTAVTEYAISCIVVVLAERRIKIKSTRHTNVGWCTDRPKTSSYLRLSNFLFGLRCVDSGVILSSIDVSTQLAFADLLAYLQSLQGDSSGIDRLISVDLIVNSCKVFAVAK